MKQGMFDSIRYPNFVKLTLFVDDIFDIFVLRLGNMSYLKDILPVFI